MYERQANESSREYASHADDQIRQSCFPLAGKAQADCIEKERREYRAERRYELDLVAQRKSANWAFIMGSAAVIGMVLSAVGVMLVWITFRATKEGNEIAQSVASNAIKPHIYPDTVVFCEIGDPLVAVRVILKNYGGGVAKGVRVFTREYKITANGRKLFGFNSQWISLPDIPPQGSRKIFRYFALGEEGRAKVASGDTVLIVRVNYTYFDELGNEADASFAFASGEVLVKDEHWYLFDMETLLTRRSAFARLAAQQRDFIDEMEEDGDEDANHDTHPV